MIKDLNFKKYENLTYQDLFDVGDYITDIYDIITINNKDDYITFLNRIRHILEIISDYGENQQIIIKKTNN